MSTLSLPIAVANSFIALKDTTTFSLLCGCLSAVEAFVGAPQADKLRTKQIKREPNNNFFNILSLLFSNNRCK
jgi:hypothetical protein